MTKVILTAAKCSQQTEPVTGTGTGGDRCTEAVGAMIDATFKISNWAKLGTNPETLMYRYTEMLNQGRDISGLENAIWIQNIILSQTHGQMQLNDKVWAQYSDIVACINRGHVAIGGFDDYVNLRLANGKNPYMWNDAHGLGHVLLIVGYDDTNGYIYVHDPLQGTSRMPLAYSWQGFVAAGFHDLMEVGGPPLTPGQGTIAPAFSGEPGLPSSAALALFIWQFVAAILQYVGVTLTRFGKK